MIKGGRGREKGTGRKRTKGVGIRGWGPSFLGGGRWDSLDRMEAKGDERWVLNT